MSNNSKKTNDLQDPQDQKMVGLIHMAKEVAELMKTNPLAAITLVVFMVFSTGDILGTKSLNASMAQISTDISLLDHEVRSIRSSIDTVDERIDSIENEVASINNSIKDADVDARILRYRVDQIENLVKNSEN